MGWLDAIDKGVGQGVKSALESQEVKNGIGNAIEGALAEAMKDKVLMKRSDFEGIIAEIFFAGWWRGQHYSNDEDRQDWFVKERDNQIRKYFSMIGKTK